MSTHTEGPMQAKFVHAAHAAQYKPFDHADRRAAKEQASAAISKATGAQS